MPRDISTPQLVKIPELTLAVIPPKHIVSLEENRKPEIREEFLRLQLKPRTRQEYSKVIALKVQEILSTSR